MNAFSVRTLGGLVSLALLSWLFVSVGARETRADVLVYQYTGTPLYQCDLPSTCTGSPVGNITGTAVFTNLPLSYTGQAFPSAIAMTALGQSVNCALNSCGLHDEGFYFSNGQITQWASVQGTPTETIDTLNNSGLALNNDGGVVDTTENFLPGPNTGPCGYYSNSPGVIGPCENFNSPGTWSLLTTTGPTSAAQLRNKLLALIAAGTITLLGIIAALFGIPSGGLSGALLALLTAIIGGVIAGYTNFDPPDYNYTAIASPTPPPLPSLPTTSCSTPATTPVFNDLLQNLGQVIGFLDASQTSFNRATGAYLSNSTTYGQLQQALGSEYLDDANPYILGFANDLRSLGASLPASCLSQTSITAGDVTTFQQQIEHNGLPQSVLDDLAALEVPSSQTSNISSVLETVDPDSLVGSYSDVFNNLAAQFDDALPASPTSVPEPASLSILITALCALVILQLPRRARFKRRY